MLQVLIRRPRCNSWRQSSKLLNLHTKLHQRLCRLPKAVNSLKKAKASKAPILPSKVSWSLRITARCTILVSSKWQIPCTSVTRRCRALTSMCPTKTHNAHSEDLLSNKPVSALPVVTHQGPISMKCIHRVGKAPEASKAITGLRKEATVLSSKMPHLRVRSVWGAGERVPILSSLCSHAIKWSSTMRPAPSSPSCWIWVYLIQCMQAMITAIWWSRSAMSTSWMPDRKIAQEPRLPKEWEATMTWT